MIATNENKYVSSYWYDADGNRTVKMHGAGTAAYVNGSPLAWGTNAYDHYTLYASPYFSITDDSLYARHVYVGGERIMTLVGRLGSRFGSYGSTDVAVVDSSLASPNINYVQKFVKMKNRIRQDFDSLGVAYKYVNPSSISKNTGYVQQAQLPSLDGLSGLGGIRADDGSRSPDGTGSSDVDDGTEPGNWQREDGSIFDEQDAVIPDETEEEEVSPSDSEDSGSDSEEDMDGLSRRELMVMAFEPLQDAEAAYYYHKDHLGSSSIITNENGEVTQRIEYLPYGDVFLEQNNTNWNTPYKFNGKELDEETGLYYYGARYYDPRLSLWLGTDPMQGKYPGISTYAYCMGNPVKYVDKDGRKTFLFATVLPYKYKWLGNDRVSSAPTHTFLVVVTDDGHMNYYAYGSKTDSPFSGDLTRVDYNQDREVFTSYFGGDSNKRLKNAIAIDAPEGMTSSEFDNIVISVAESFGNEGIMTYNILPGYNKLKGNCNTSSSTILYKSGVSKKKLDEYKQQMSGVISGFGDIRPWTYEEQEQTKKEEEILSDQYREFINMGQ